MPPQGRVEVECPECGQRRFVIPTRDIVLRRFLKRCKSCGGKRGPKGMAAGKRGRHDVKVLAEHARNQMMERFGQNVERAMSVGDVRDGSMVEMDEEFWTVEQPSTSPTGICTSLKPVLLTHWQTGEEMAVAKRRKVELVEDGFGEDGTWWTQEDVIGAIQAWVKRTGVPPTRRQWHTTGRGREENAPGKVGEWPSSGTVVRLFGSWNAAIEAAGFEPVAAAWEREDVIAAIQAWAERAGEPPTKKQWRATEERGRPSLGTIERLFGSWNGAIKAAGFTPRPPWRPRP